MSIEWKTSKENAAVFEKELTNNTEKANMQISQEFKRNYCRGREGASQRQ